MRRKFQVVSHLLPSAPVFAKCGIARTYVILAFKKLKQEDHELEVSLDNTVRLS